MRYILSILILLCSVTAFSQVPEQFLGSPGNRIVVRGQLKIDSSLIVPIRLDTLFIPGTANALVYNSSDKRIYYYNGLRWHGVMYGDSLVYATAFGVDTAKSNIRSEIALSLDSIVIYTASGTNPDTLYSYKDGDSVLVGYIPKFTGITTDATLTGNGLSGNPLKADTIVLSTRQWRQKGIDSLNSVLRQTIADSAATKLDSIHVYAASDPDPDTLYSYKNGDSVFIGLIQKPGISTTWGTIGGTLSDQTDLQSALDTKLDSLHIYTASDPDPDTIYQYKSGDSSLVGYIPKGGASEAVTTDATLTGDGTEGNPLKVDTLLISTRAWRQKGDDSLGAIIATKLSAVNLDTTRDATSATILNDAGDDAVIPLVSIPADKAGLISPAMAAHIDSSMNGLLLDTIVVTQVNDDAIRMVWANDAGDTLFTRQIEAGTNITIDTTGGKAVISATSSGEGTVKSGTLTPVRIPIVAGADSLTDDPNLTFDSVTNKLTTDSIAVQKALIGDGSGVFGDYPLEILSDATPRLSIYATGPTPVNPYIDFKTTNTSLSNTSDVTGRILGTMVGTGGAIRFQTSASTTGTMGDVLFLSQSGGANLVGIGTTSPDARLDVEGTGTQFRLTHTSGSVYSDFRTFSTGILRITSTASQISTDRLHLGAASNPALTPYMLNVDGSIRSNKDSIPLVESITNEHVLIQDTTTGMFKRIPSSVFGGGGLSGSGVAGEVAFWDGASSLTSDGNFLFSAANNGELSVAGKVSAGSIVVGDNRNMSSGAPQFYAIPSTYTDITTAGGGTTTWVINLFGQPTIAAANSNVSIIKPATLKVDPPIAGTNVTFTGPPFAITTEGAIELGGGIKRSFGGQVSGTTVDHTLDIITCNATSGNYTITLPDATLYTGFTFTFKRTDGSVNTCTINTTSSQTIDGAGSYSLSAQYKYVTVVSDGSNWLIIANN